RPQPLCFEAAPARAGARHGRASPGATARGARSPAGGPARGGHGAEQPQAVVGDAGRRRGPRRARTGRGRRRGVAPSRSSSLARRRRRRSSSSS
ncbi:unnamed protein product, partial [Prorocentrum cordatum]